MVNNEKIISQAISINIETRNFLIELAEKTNDRNLQEILFNIITIKEYYIKYLIKTYADSEYQNIHEFDNFKDVFHFSDISYSLSTNDSVYKLAIDLCNKAIRHYLKNMKHSWKSENEKLLTELISMEHEHINCFNYLIAV